MKYMYNMICNYEIVTIQNILFGKNYRWSNSGQNLIFENYEYRLTIYIDTGRKLLYTFSWEDDFIKIPSLEEFLDKVESDEI